MSQLKGIYQEKLVPQLLGDLKIKNKLAVPRLEKIVVNMGVGKFKDNEKYLENAKKELALITGQIASVRHAKIAISGFKLRKGEPVGLTVTLREKKMWDFFEKLITIVLPRVRDFRGIKRTSFDGQGNYTLGIQEHTTFAEIDPNKTDRTKSLEITIVTTTSDDEAAFKLLEKLGVPFKKQ